MRPPTKIMKTGEDNRYQIESTYTFSSTNALVTNTEGDIIPMNMNESTKFGVETTYDSQNALRC